MTVTIQKVVGALRSAHLPIAPRGMLSTRGFQVERVKRGTVVVRYSIGADSLSDEDYRARVDGWLSAAQRALESRQIPVEFKPRQPGHDAFLVCGSTPALVEIREDMV